jgi:hypothetical protein
MARFESDCSPRRPLKIFHLPRRRSVLTLLTLTSNSFSTASLICGLVAVSDERGDDDVVMARIGGGHLKRASNASTAALVSTSLCRRMMS